MGDSSEKKQVDSLVRRFVTFAIINKETTSFGKRVDNKNDAVGLGSLSWWADAPECVDFFAKEEKKHHEDSPQ